MIKYATYQGPWVGFGPFVQQNFGHAVVPAVCCHMQRGKMVQCDVINLCVILQKLLDAVHVVPLCCHVDWREAILQKIKMCWLSNPCVKTISTKSSSKRNLWLHLFDESPILAFIYWIKKPRTNDAHWSGLITKPHGVSQFFWGEVKNLLLLTPCSLP